MLTRQSRPSSKCRLLLADFSEMASGASRMLLAWYLETSLKYALETVFQLI